MNILIDTAGIALILGLLAFSKCCWLIACIVVFAAGVTALCCNAYTITIMENRRFFMRAVRSIQRETVYAREYRLENSEFLPFGWVAGAGARWFARIDSYTLTYYTWKWNRPPRYDEDPDTKESADAPLIDEFTSAFEVNRTVAYVPRDLERVPHSMPIARRIVEKLLDMEQESGARAFGGVFAFNAPSGAGKTMATRCLARLLNATLLPNWDATQLDFFVDIAIPTRDRPLLLVIEDADAIVHRIPNAAIDAIKKYSNVILIMTTTKHFTEIRMQKPILLRPGRIDAVFHFETRGYLAENV